MRREEVRKVIGAFYDPDSSAYARDRRNLVVAPFETVQEAVNHEKLGWTQEDIRLVAAVLAHESSTQTIELMETILSFEEMIWDIISTARPASNSALVMQVFTLALGVVLTLASVIAAVQGQAVLGGLLGGLGASSFLYLFFREPVKGVQRGISNLVQLEMIYNGYVKQLAYWKAYERTDDLSLKPAILNEIETCTGHTMFLIQKYAERGTPLPQVPQSDMPLESDLGSLPQTPPKPFAEKLAVMDKMPTMDGFAEGTTASAAYPEVAPPVPGPPLKIFRDAKLPESDEMPTMNGVTNAATSHPDEVTGEGEIPRASAEDSTVSGGIHEPMPFVLATPHQAPTWKEHELAAIERALGECSAAIAIREHAIQELKDAAGMRPLSPEEDLRLASLQKEHEDLSAEYEALMSSKDALM